MSYYILPKNNNIININPKDSYSDICEPYMCSSLLNYYNEINNHLNYLCKLDCDLSCNNYEDIIKIIYPYEYLYIKKSNLKQPINKLKYKTNLFYDFIEIFNLLNIFEIFNNIAINTFCITSNYNDFVECIEIYRNNYNDVILYYNEVDDNAIKNIHDKKFDFLFFETEFHSINSYIYKLIEFIMIILKNQKKDGTTIIKINCIFHKPIVDVLYILSSLFQKTYIIKPSTCNIASFDKYIVCKNFIIDEFRMTLYKLNYYKLLVFIKKLGDKNILSILDYNIPYYFVTKLYDINIIFGQQQLEAIEQIVNILKSKNKKDKFDILKKNNIQKSIFWCEKYKIPYNNLF
jgi:hypothetical protein